MPEKSSVFRKMRMLVFISIHYTSQVLPELLHYYHYLFIIIIIPENIKQLFFYISPSVFSSPLQPPQTCRSDADVWRSERCCTPARDASSFQRHGGRNPHGPYLIKCCRLRRSFCVESWQPFASSDTYIHAVAFLLQMFNVIKE